MIVADRRAPKLTPGAPRARLVRSGLLPFQPVPPPLRFDGVMTQPAFIPSDRRIVDTVIGLASIAKSHRVILAGSNSFEMQRRGSAMFLAVSTTWHSSPGTASRSGFSNDARRACTFSQRRRRARDLGRHSSNVQSGTQASAEKARLSYRIRDPLRRWCDHVCLTDRIELARERRVRQ